MSDAVPIDPGAVRYIKLGRGGVWDDVSLDHGEMHFGYSRVPHEVALSADKEKIRQAIVALGERDPQAIADDVREVMDFYTLGPDCLWVTFARDQLWWAFADPEVIWLGPGDGHGARKRKVIGAWRNTDIAGELLRMDRLSTKLTKVASYRRTICAVEARTYLLRKVNGTVEPLVQRSTAARDALVEIVSEAIGTLHWADFETLVDVIFARSGWHRASAIGGTQKLFDLIVEQPTSNEVAGVQVKSAASQDMLSDFVQKADATGHYDRLFFVCHTPRGKLAAPRSNVHVWFGRRLAEIALRVGLADWVIAKVA